MAMKIFCAESGYWIEIDGILSEAHRYGYACITKGPSGTLYGTLLEEEPEPGKKAQLYRLIPVDALTESELSDEGIEYQELEDPDGEGDEIEVEDDAEADDEAGDEEGEDDDDDEDDEKSS